MNVFEDKDTKNVILVCSCNNIEHQLNIFKDEDDKNAYLDVHLKPGNFRERLVRGLKYIFGHRSIYGDFDEFLFDRNHADALIELGNFLKNEK